MNQLRKKMNVEIELMIMICRSCKCEGRKQTELDNESSFLNLAIGRNSHSLISKYSTCVWVTNYAYQKSLQSTSSTEASTR